MSIHARQAKSGDGVMAVKDTQVPCLEGQQHHWIIDTANGPNSKGTCQRCKKESMFENSIEASTYEQQEIWRNREHSRIVSSSKAI